VTYSGTSPEFRRFAKTEPEFPRHMLSRARCLGLSRKAAERAILNFEIVKDRSHMALVRAVCFPLGYTASTDDHSLRADPGAIEAGYPTILQPADQAEHARPHQKRNLDRDKQTL